MSLGSYATRHAHACVSSMGRLTRNPFGTMLTLIVIALALALPAGLELFVTNARTATGGFSSAIDLSVYLKAGTALTKAQQLASSARGRADVAQVEVISSEQALQEFRAYSGFGAALEALQENPLPHVLHVRPKAEADTPAALENLRRYFSAWPEVELVQIDSDWVKRFGAILDVLRNLLAVAALLLGVGVLAIVGNTIRLEILQRRAEIEVTKLVGGSNAFVRRPFLYAGLFYGTGGALLAWGLLAGSVAWLSGPVGRLAQLYGSRYSLASLNLTEAGVLLGCGAVLGWLGAWVSTSRQLRNIEPRA